MSQKLRFRAQILAGKGRKRDRGIVHYGCDCNLEFSGAGDFESYDEAVSVATGDGARTLYLCPLGVGIPAEPTAVPENWLYMAKHANTESARAWWRKKCGITIEMEN
jgi:hypothetical protein